MKFFMTPGSCSTGIHILLEELELSFEAHVLNLPKGEHLRPEFLALNPKGTIPTLVLDDGRVLTDFTAIAWWLALTHPKASLLPSEPYAQAHALELLHYIVGTVHGHGYTRIFTTERFLVGDAGELEQEAVREQGRTLVLGGLRLLERELDRREFVLGRFSVVDPALFYVEFWADKLGLPLPEGCARHYARMRERRAVHQVLREEGYR